MAEQMGLMEFFAMEAGDYLERLDAVVSKGGEPDRDEFVRLTRALRGSALMANQQAFAGAAGGLERLARAVRDRSRPWDTGTKQAAVRAVDDLKVLVRKVRSWSEADTASAQRLAESLAAIVGGGARPSGAARAPAAGERAFVAQQGASLASALEQAAGALEQNPLAHNPLQGILKTMQPLRGIASLADHPPLPDLLDGIDRAIAELSRRKEPVEGGAAVFRTAAQAVSSTARAIATNGKATPDAPEAAAFARQLSRLLGLDREVVTIESLFYGDGGPHVVQEGAPPGRPGKLGSLELVSHGEYLRQAADALERAQSGVQRELRAHALVGTFRTLGSAGGGPLGSALEAFARRAREAVAGGRALEDPQGFARWIREAGFALSRAATDAEDALVRQLEGVIAGMGGGPGASAEPVAPRQPAPAAPTAPHRPRAPSAMSPPVSEEAPTRPAPSWSAPPGEVPALVAGYRHYEQLATMLGSGAPSLDELLAGPPAAAHGATPATPAAAQDVVPITQLCYSGEAAIERALSLRDRVRAALADATSDGAAVNDLIEEIFDLVQLGTGRTH
jgi:hypothetical protein